MTITQHPQVYALHSQKKGSVFISIVVAMLILGVLGTALVSFSRSSEHSYLSANSKSRAYYLAESGLRYAQKVFCEEGWLHGRERTLTFDGGDRVEIIRIAGTFWATATVDAGTAKQARASIPMPLSSCGDDPDIDSPPITIDEFAIFGDIGIALGNNMIVEGNVAIIDDNVEIQGDIDGNVLAHDVEFTAHGVVSGSIFASGSVDIRVGTVNGDIHAQNSVTLRSTNATVFEGWVFSIAGPVTLEGKSQVRGHVHACDGDVFLGGTASVGTAANPAEIRASGDVSLSGSSIVYGDIHAGGSVNVGSGTVVGNIYAGGFISSGSVLGQTFSRSPGFVKEAICPDLTSLEDLILPEATVFSTGGNDIILKKNQSNYLLPGSYGTIFSANNAQDRTYLYLNAGATDHGEYYFDEVDVGRNMTFYFDLSGTFDIRIFVEGDINVGSDLNLFISEDGSNYLPISSPDLDTELASRVYWETKEDFDLGSTIWWGSVYTPNGSLSVGNSSYLVGSFWSGGGHSFQGSTIVHVEPNYFDED